MADISPDAQKALETLAQVYPELAQLLKTTKKLNESLGDQLKQTDKWEKALDDHLKKLNETSSSGLGKFINALKTGDAGMQRYKDTLKSLDEAIEKLTDATDDAANGAQRNELIQRRQLLENKIALSEFNAKVINSGKVLTTSLTGTLASAVTKTTGDFVKGLQNGSDANQLSSNILTSAVDAAASGAGAMTGALQSTGAVMQNSTNPKLKALGLAAEGAGAALGFFAQGASKLAKFGIEVLSKEVEKTVNAFNATSAAGAMFTDGMTGMRNAAKDSGLTIEQFSKVVSQNSEQLAQSGLGVTEGAKQMGRVGKQIKDSGVDKQLLKLGYSFEEQASLTAETIANMRKSAGGKVSDRQVAEQTQKYAENLRVIAAITGEDARKKAEQAKQQNQILAFQQEMAKKTPEQRAQIDAAMATMTEQEKKNFRDRVVLGTVINKEGAIYEATVAGAREKGEAALRLFNDNLLTAEANSKLNAQYGDQIKESALNNKSLGVASYVAGGALEAVGGAMLDSVNQAVTYTADAVKAGKEVVDKQKATNDEMTQSVTNAAIAAQGLKVAIEESLIAPMKNYAKVTEEIITSIQKMVSEVTGADSATGEPGFLDKLKSAGLGALERGSQAGLAGAAIGGTVGTTIAPLAGTAVGGLGMGAVGAIVGGIGGAIEGWFNAKKGKAIGGIASGPETGYLEKLHGTEAVVPLEGGRSIPVSLNFSDVMPKTMTSMLDQLTKNESNRSSLGNTANVNNLFDKFTLTESKMQSLMSKNSNNETNKVGLGAMSNMLSKLNLANNAPSLDMSSAFKSFSDMSTKINAKFENQISPVNKINETASTFDFSSISNMVKDAFTNISKQEKPLKSEEKSTTLYSDKTVKSTLETELTNIVKEQIRILSEIKDTLNTSRDLQQQYVYNTYT